MGRPGQSGLCSGGDGCGGFFRRNPGLIVVLAAHLAAFFIIGPFFEVALGDDWAYARTVQRLVETGGLTVSDFLEPSFVFLAYWGALFSKLFGYSFTTLRVSVFVLSLVFSVVFYLFVKRFRVSEFLATVAVLFVIFNPLYFDLTFSFVTEIPYMALLFLSLYFYMSGVEGEESRIGWLILGSVFAALAFLTRQLGLFIAPVVVLYLLFNMRSVSSLVKNILAASAVPAITVVLYFVWFFGGGSTWAQRNISFKATFGQLASPVAFAGEFWVRVFSLLEYAGLFIFPLLAIYLVASRGKVGREERRPFLYVFGFWGVVIGATAIWMGGTDTPMMPYMPQSLATFPSIIPPWAWFVITVISTIGSVTLLSLVTCYGYKFLKEKGLKSFTLFFALFFFLQAGTTLVHSHVYDIYLIPWLPFLFLLAVWLIDKRSIGLPSKAIIVVLLLFSLFYSVGNSKARFNMAEAKWKAGEELLALGVGMDEMDISFEWNGYHLYDEVMEELLDLYPEEKLALLAPLEVVHRRAKFYVIPEPGELALWEIPFEVPLPLRIISKALGGAKAPKEDYLYLNAYTYKDYARVVTAKRKGSPVPAKLK